jgi:hypothetical protein
VVVKEGGPTGADLSAARAFAASLPTHTTLKGALAALPLGAVARLVQLRTTTTSSNGAGDSGGRHEGGGDETPTCHIPAAGEALLAELRSPGGAARTVGAALDAAHPVSSCAGRAAAEAGGGLVAEKVTLFLASLPWKEEGPLPSPLQPLITPSPGSLAAAEAQYLAKQWAELPELERLGAACAAACACGEREAA